MATKATVFNSKNGINYPSPFLDIASTYTPPVMKEMFKWTRYFYYSSSIISPIAFKLSEYPVTGLNYTGGEEKDLKFILDRSIKLKTKQVEINLDYHVFGNSFVSIHWPMRRFLQCPSCKNKVSVKKINYKWKNMEFWAKCKSDKCSYDGKMKIVDENVKLKREVRLIRWSPFYIDIDWNPITDRHIYTYTIPKKIMQKIRTGNKSYIEDMPEVFIEAVKNKKKIEIDQNNIYHFKRPNIADEDMGWGMPVMLPVMKDMFFLNVLKKGNEAISLGHIIPWRIVYPSTGSGQELPYVNQNLGQWRSKVEGEIKKWRRDPNHISIMPLPAGAQSVGGDAKMLTTFQEEKAIKSDIAGGMGVPLELIFGSMNWTGSSVSLRILENHFIKNRSQHDDFIQEFLVPKIKHYFGIKDANVSQKDFKMADDIQFKSLVGNLMQAGKVSTEDYLKELGFDYKEQIKKMSKETDMEAEVLQKRMKHQAITQNMVNRLNAIAQQKFQSYMQENQGAPQAATQGGQGEAPGGAQGPVEPQEGDPGLMQQGGVPSEAGGPDEVALDIPTLVVSWASNIAKLPRGERDRALKRMAATSPETAKAVKKEVSRLRKGIEDMKIQTVSQPEQKPPRSNAAGI